MYFCEFNLVDFFIVLVIVVILYSILIDVVRKWINIKFYYYYLSVFSYFIKVGGKIVIVCVSGFGFLILFFVF